MTKFYWSRVPGKFVNERTGAEICSGPIFTGTVREWYETLFLTIERCYDVIVSNIHKDSSICVANLYVHPIVLCILECSVFFKSIINIDKTLDPRRKGVLGSSKKFIVFCEPDQDIKTIRLEVIHAMSNVAMEESGNVEVKDINIIA